MSPSDPQPGAERQPLAAKQPAWMPDLKLPARPVSAALVVVFLGFGWVIGAVTGSPARGTLVASRVVIPQATPTTTSASPGTEPPLVPSATATPPATLPTGVGPSAKRHANSQPPPSTSSAAPSEAGSSDAAAKQESTKSQSQSATGLPAIKHVFLIVLANQPYASLFGPSSGSSYLSKTLARQGELLVRYYAVVHDELANGIALVSGQGPTAETAVNCPSYANLAPATAGSSGQTLGHGCVYPRTTETLPGQLLAKHLTWRAYVDGMGEPTCEHPALGATDPSLSPPGPVTGTSAASQSPLAYGPAPGIAAATFRNPFVYFHGVIDKPTCATNDVGLSQLSTDLASPQHTPNFSYIVPSLCNDGRSTACEPGQPAGLPATDVFLHKVVPEILASAAYKQGGLLVITADQAPATGIDADSSSCCGQPTFPALPPPAPLPGGGRLPPSGGGQVGALLLSPFVKPGTVDQDPYNHFGLLRTIEDLFGLHHLGYAGGDGVKAFGPTVFTK